MVPACGDPFDSIPVGPSERVLLDQPFTVPGSGATSNLYVPERASVSLDYSIEPGKRLLLMVITEEQFAAVSAGEQATGEPPMKIIVSGVGTQTIVLDRGTYTVALIAQDGQQSTEVAIRARASAM
ncbi:MAG: hypothetical protein WCA81_02675 [Rhizomicrobium sp.]